MSFAQNTCLESVDQDVMEHGGHKPEKIRELLRKSVQITEWAKKISQLVFVRTSPNFHQFDDFWHTDGRG